MPHRTLLIDAHNVIHHAAALRRLMHEPERARAALEALLAGRRDVLLFYDGGPGGVPTHSVRGGLRIDYSGSGDADDRIVAWLRGHPGVPVAVVSDDGGLRRRAQPLGAVLLSTRRFLATLRVGATPALVVKPDHVPPHEVDMWLQEFGEPPR